MHIDKSKIELKFTFSPKEYFLVYADDQFGLKQWSLNYRIDRSEKGKDDDVGMPKIYLTEEEAERAKKNGFSWTEM